MRNDRINRQKFEDSMKTNKVQLGKRHRKLAFKSSEENSNNSSNNRKREQQLRDFDVLKGCASKRQRKA